MNVKVLKNIKLAKIVFLSMAIMSSGMARAAYSCNAQITSVLVYSDGNVNVNHTGRGDYTIVCNLNTSWKSVTTTACAGWLGMLLQAKRNNTQLQFYYDGSGACNTLPTYGNAPAPVYIGPAN